MGVDVLDPGEVGIAHGRHAIAPAAVLPQDIAGPVGDVEGRISEDVVEAFVGESVADQRAFGVPADVGEDAPDGEVHAGKAEGGVVTLLPVDGDVV
jgi:hypothetical protein